MLSSQKTIVAPPDILMVAGLTMLQPAHLPKDGTAIPLSAISSPVRHAFRVPPLSPHPLNEWQSD
jgi:hypothetical protein